MRKHNKTISIKDLMCDIDQDLYSNQTIQSLSRSFLETIIENRSNAVILVKIRETKNFQALLDRLKYTDTKVYSYCGNIDGFNTIGLMPKQKEGSELTAKRERLKWKSHFHVKKLVLDSEKPQMLEDSVISENRITNSLPGYYNYPQMENDEFFVIIAERFSACLYWSKVSSENFDLCEGFCSLNPGEIKKIIEHLQTVAYSKELEADLSEVLQDRRNNEKFTGILRKIVADLENRQRDLICVNMELKEVQENSEESKKLASLSQLFSTAMHEIRNPLGAIDLHSKIISKKLENIKTEDTQIIEEVIESLSLIRKTTENLEKTLTELLDFSKPLTLEKSELNLKEAVNEIITLIKPSYDSKNIGLTFKNSLNTNFLIGFDRAKFHQVIFNILKNALEASEKESAVKVTLTGEQNNIYLKISDQGIGISEENRERIFKPYYTTKKEGTGLGLAEARKIVEAHEGALYVEPNTLDGTTFVMTLPALCR